MQVLFESPVPAAFTGIFTREGPMPIVSSAMNGIDSSGSCHETDSSLASRGSSSC